MPMIRTEHLIVCPMHLVLLHSNTYLL